MSTPTQLTALLPIDYSQIPKKPRIPLWPKHLYRGTVTMIAGAAGTGKGLAGIHCAATVVKGGLFPGEYTGTTRDRTPGSVIGIWPEDDPNEDLAWRLDCALDGAGLTETEKHCVYDMTETGDGEPFELNNGGTESLARVRAVIDQLAHCTGTVPECGCGGLHAVPHWPARLLIVDPLLAVCDTVQTNKQARKTVRPLMKLAKTTGIAVLVIHHTVKDGKTIAGSKGLIDVLRLVFMLKPDPMQDDVKVLSVEKSNNLGHIGDLRYEISGNSQEPWLTWHEGNKAAPKPATTPSDGRYAQQWRMPSLRP